MAEHAEHHLLGSYIRRFLLEHVVADRNLSRHTQRSYRDGIRVLLRFMTERHRIDPADLTVETSRRTWCGTSSNISNRSAITPLRR